MKAFWENELVEIAAYYSVAVLCLVLFLTIFELVTSYKKLGRDPAWQLSCCHGNRREDLWDCECVSAFNRTAQFPSSNGWMGVYGFVMLLVSYFIFEFLTPRFKVDKEIENDNRAVGFISLIISVGLSYVVAAGI